MFLEIQRGFRKSKGDFESVTDFSKCSDLVMLGKVRFFLGGRAGAPEGRDISESEHQKGRAIPHVSYSREGYTSFPEFLMRIFVMLLSIFVTD